MSHFFSALQGQQLDSLQQMDEKALDIIDLKLWVSEASKRQRTG